VDLNVLRNISYGMFIVSSSREKALNGQIANTVFQITSEPPTIAISINKSNLTHEFIESSSVFTISILEESTPLKFIGKFGFKSGRVEDKFKDTRYEKSSSGCPVVTECALAYLEARVIKKLDCLTHTLFLGQLTDSKIISEGKPMTYSYYHEVKRGTTPASAPTFIKNESMPSAGKKVE